MVFDETFTCKSYWARENAIFLCGTYFTKIYFYLSNPIEKYQNINFWALTFEDVIFDETFKSKSCIACKNTTFLCNYNAKAQLLHIRAHSLMSFSYNRFEVAVHNFNKIIPNKVYSNNVMKLKFKLSSGSNR